MKFSVLGTGRMAGKMADTTIAYMDDVKAYAAASRSPEKARDFAAAHGFAKAYGSYEECLRIRRQSSSMWQRRIRSTTRTRKTVCCTGSMSSWKRHSR